MATNITSWPPAYLCTEPYTPALPAVERSYERLAMESLEPDLHLADNEQKVRVRRDKAREVAQGQIIFTHYVNSDEHAPPEDIEELRRTQFASTAEAEAALDKLDGIISQYAAPQAQAFLDSVALVAEHYGQSMRSVRISVTMGMNLTNIEGISWDAADRLVAGRMREAVKEKRRDLLVEICVIPPTINKSVVLRWDALDGPSSTNATRAAILDRHTEL